MGLTIAVETERGECLERVGDPRNILARRLPSPDDTEYQCLGMIDLYGDTVFNYLQIPRFLDELHRIASPSPSPEESALFKRIEEMARRVAEERFYLKFIGD
jgi:hypothetical protein